MLSNIKYLIFFFCLLNTTLSLSFDNFCGRETILKQAIQSPLAPYYLFKNHSPKIVKEPLCFTQTNEVNPEIEAIKAMDRSEIIKLAIDQIPQKIKAKNYDVKVMANSKSVYVFFDLLPSIVYLPTGEVYHYGISVKMLDRSGRGTVNYSTTNIPKGYNASKEETPIFKLNGKAKKKIKFVVDALNRQSNRNDGIIISTDGNECFEDHMEIYEHRFAYEVFVMSDEYEWGCHIGKKSGKMYDRWFANIEEEPEPEPTPPPSTQVKKKKVSDPLKEIK